MRFPIRLQFLLPLSVVAAASLATIALINARSASHRTRSRIENQLRGAAEVLENSNFPLTNTVLRQMGELAGAEFVLTTESWEVLGNSGAKFEQNELPRDRPPAITAEELTLGGPLLFGGSPYYYSALALPRRPPVQGRQTLHIFFPQDDYNTAWRAAFLPPLAVGAATLFLVALVSHVVASRISRILDDLQGGVRLLAEGGFDPVALPVTDDETRDLAMAVNQTLVRLKKYDAEVRETERLRTLSVLGAGLAHEIRNAATGCRMAIDLHSQSDGPIDSTDDCLDVARLQLTLIERRLTQFMKLGDDSAPSDRAETDLGEVVSEVFTLVTPSAKHGEVELEWLPRPTPPAFGDPGQLGQVVMNLTLNALHAASRHKASSGRRAYVRAELNQRGPNIELLVADSGAGPGEAVADSLFEPFVTDKPEGIGIGLSVARRVVESLGGELGWRREADETRFLVRLPVAGGGETNAGRDR